MKWIACSRKDVNLKICSAVQYKNDFMCMHVKINENARRGKGGRRRRRMKKNDNIDDDDEPS